MKKHIWMMNHYAGGMLFDRGGRHYNFAKYLKRVGYEPVVFCSNARHNSQAETFFPMSGLWEAHCAEEIDVPFVFVESRAYVGNGKQRVLNMVDFYRNVKKAAKEYAAQNGKPDVIYASSVHPLTLMSGIQLAKFFGVKCICEVRDLWPESIVAYSSRLKKSNPLVKALYAGEKWIYRKADALIFTMAGGYDYIMEQGWTNVIPRGKVFHINNGVDLEVFQQQKKDFPYYDEDLKDPNLFKIIFTGTLVPSNNIDGMLDLAKRLLKYENLRLLIWGGGIETESMLRRIKEDHISNVLYKGCVEKKYIPYIVSNADVNFMHAAPTSLYRFGASPNKLFDYLAAGQAILQDFTYQEDLVREYRCGLSCDWDLDAVEAMVDQLYQMDADQRDDMRRGCQIAAADHHFEKLTDRLIRIIEGT